MIDLATATDILEQAALQPDGFSAALEQAGRALRFDHFFLFRMDVGRPDFVAASEPHDQIRDYVKRGWWEVDHRTEYNRRALAPGLIIRDHLTVPDHVRARSAIYNDLYNPGGWNWNTVWQFDIGDECWAFSGMRSSVAGPVSDLDARILARIAPIANRAASTAIHLRNAQVSGHATGIDIAGMSAVVLDHNGNVFLHTSACERVFDETFFVKRGKLWAIDPEARLGLSAFERFATGYLETPTLPDLLIHRGDGRRPLLAQPLPIRGDARERLPGGRLVISLIDLDKRPLPQCDLLRQIFGLTSREAEIASLVAAGDSPETISGKLSLKISTVRDHLKAVLGKTDCSRQVELTALLGRFPRR